jgi:hypothetical protein
MILNDPQRQFSWPDKPIEYPSNIGHFSMLPDVVINKCFSFVGTGHFQFVGFVCKHFREVYLQEESDGKVKCVLQG